MPAWVSIVLILIVGGVAIYVVVRLLSKKDNDRQKIVDKAQAEVEDIKAVADAQLEAELQEVDADKTELAKIGEIKDDAVRLDALANYGNRKRR